LKDGANARRRVVVTGMGAVTPIGLDVEEMWASMQAGRCGVKPVENWPLDDLYIKIAGEIRDFDPVKHVKSRKIQYGDRYSWFAGKAADEAWTQSGLANPYPEPYRAASIIGSGAGGFSTIESAYRDLFVLHKKATNPLTLLRIIGSSASAHVGIEYGIKGPTFATCSACSTATHAIGIGLDYIRNGVTDVAVTGASEAVLTYG
jgi:nodulation protein E